MSQPTEQGERFKFIPFIEQDPTQQRIHRILLPLRFDPGYKIEAVGIVCDQCHNPFSQVIKEYSYGWGEEKRLEIVVSDVPEIECGCESLMDTRTRNAISNAGRPIRTALELYGANGDPTALDPLKISLTVDDLLKIADFANYRWHINLRQPYLRLVN